METSSTAAFRHRQNQDGTWDSICLRCFLTVVTVSREADLAKAEKSHHGCVELMRDAGYAQNGRNPARRPQARTRGEEPCGDGAGLTGDLG